MIYQSRPSGFRSRWLGQHSDPVACTSHVCAYLHLNSGPSPDCVSTIMVHRSEYRQLQSLCIHIVPSYRKPLHNIHDPLGVLYYSLVLFAGVCHSIPEAAHPSLLSLNPKLLCQCWERVGFGDAITKTELLGNVHSLTLHCCKIPEWAFFPHDSLSGPVFSPVHKHLGAT